MPTFCAQFHNPSVLFSQDFASSIHYLANVNSSVFGAVKHCARAAIVIALFAANLASAAITHRWSFNEASGTGIIDSIGTANGSVMVIGTNTDYSRVSGMVRLAGGTRAQADYVQFPANLVDTLTNASIELWATPRAGQNWSRLFDFGPGNDTQAGTFFHSFCIDSSVTPLLSGTNFQTKSAARTLNPPYSQ